VPVAEQVDLASAVTRLVIRKPLEEPAVDAPAPFAAVGQVRVRIPGEDEEDSSVAAGEAAAKEKARRAGRQAEADVQIRL
jgi:hypothetical protein